MVFAYSSMSNDNQYDRVTRFNVDVPRARAIICAADVKDAILYQSAQSCYRLQGWKRWFLRFGFLWFKKNKNLERSDFLDFMVLFRYCCFCINYLLKPYMLLFVYYNLIFNLHEFVFYSIYTALPLASVCASRVPSVLGYFGLNLKKYLKNVKTIKTIKKQKKNKIKNKSNFKKPLVFSTPDRLASVTTLGCGQLTLAVTYRPYVQIQ